MRKLLLLAALPLAACSSHGSGADAAGVPASGSGTSRSYAVSGFSGVDLRGSDDAEVRVGGAFSVRAQGPSDMLDDLQIVKDGDTLKIGRKSHSGFHWGAGRKVKVFVTMPSIASAGVAGSGDMTIDKVAGGAFSGSTAGSGDLSIQHLEAASADLSIAGSGSISAAGRVQQASLSIAGSGDIDAGGLALDEAKVSVAGSGDVKAMVNGHAKVSMMGSGDVDLGGGATCDVSKMGSGTVTCGH
jgi:hypothetical protein